MAASIKEIETLVTHLGFTPKAKGSRVFEFKYPKHAHYTISVDLTKTRATDVTIDYGPKITGDRNTTGNLAQSETLVVLECVHRLLLKGYKPESIVLEKKWKLGHDDKGFLDIFVVKDDAAHTAYLMIECKTWGKEFEAEKRKMLDTGGQLFSYFDKDRNTEALCLYASRLNANNGDPVLETAQAIVPVKQAIPKLAEARSDREIYAKWDRTFAENGIFNPEANPYELAIQRIKRRDLEAITAENSRTLFNEFLEILRHNAVSDKPNAFNKIVNLFLCKIADEDKHPNGTDTMDFQWAAGERPEDVIGRLNDLYRKGMEDFLKKIITDCSDDELQQALATTNNDVLKSAVRDIITGLRLYKNQEFAFREVNNRESFLLNAQVVQEIVLLLQKRQLRYTTRHQFLGDFFENMLKESLKQESGQYFTPIPIARFLCRSIPFAQIVEGKAKRQDPNFLPYIIDYACGAGHFLTEAMHWVDQSIVGPLASATAPEGFSATMKRNLRGWKVEYEWAKEFVYGIEKDSRLAKTAKLACFLNGDGLAEIIEADALDHFADGLHFTRLLSVSNLDKTPHPDNPKFDVVLANPPYSVKAFKRTLRRGRESFSLFDRISDDGDEIECLFVERSKQLLRQNGCAGLILPNTILTGGGSYKETRELILRFFRIRAIVEFGRSTFMATNAGTMAIFLERRADADHKHASEALKAALDSPTIEPERSIENDALLASYVDRAWNGLSVEDYRTLHTNRPSAKARRHKLTQSYIAWFNHSADIKQTVSRPKFKELEKIARYRIVRSKFLERLQTREREKLCAWFLCGKQSVVLVKVPSDLKEEKEFLGYEFSERRGNEGIHPIKKGHSIDELTSLYDAEDTKNTAKVSSHVLAAFTGEAIAAPTGSLKDILRKRPLTELIRFDDVEFDTAIVSSSQSEGDTVRFVPSAFEGLDKYAKEPLSALAEVNPSKREVSGTADEILVTFLPMEAISNDGRILKREDRPFRTVKKGFTYFREGDLLFAKITPCMENGKGAVAERLSNGLGFGSTEFHVVRPGSRILGKFLFEVMQLPMFRREAEAKMTGKVGQKRVPESFLQNYMIPVPPPEIQNAIVKDIVAVEKMASAAAKQLVGDNEEKAGEIVRQSVAAKITAILEQHLKG